MNTLTSVSVTPRARRLWCVGLAVLMALFMSTPPAAAQLSRIGDNPGLINMAVRGNDTGYDPINNVYLVVGTHGSLQGVFVNSAGAPVTAPFNIAEGGQFPQFPRVLYSPHVNNGAGGFLVSWHDGFPTNFVHLKLVAYPNQLLTAPVAVPSGGSFHERAPSIAYSPTSRVFLVVWEEVSRIVMGVRVGLTGQPLGQAFAIVNPGAGAGARDPNAAWNPYTNEFGVVFTGFGSSGATTGFARVSADGTVLRRNTFNVTGLGTYITDIAMNTSTGRFLAAWYQQGSGALAAEIDGNGDVVSQGLLSTTTGAYDGLSVAYDAVSGTFLMVGHGPSYDVWGAELNSRGARTSGDAPITSAGGPKGSFYPRATANTEAAQWDVSFDHNFTLLRDQVVATSSSGGGPAGSLGAPSGGGTTQPPPPPPPGGCTTPDPFAAIGGGTCVNGGWVPGSSGSGGTNTGGCTTAAPGPGWTCVNGGWVPGTTGSGGTNTGGCTTAAPGPGWTCVNGGWVPGTTGSGGTNTGGCTTPAPGAGWTCVNGGWVPGTSGSGGTSTGGCTSPSPGAGWTCVNGGWVPGGSGSGCTTPSPGGGWSCINGGWVPPTSSCTTPSPGAGWACVNGGWVPGGSGGGGSASGCTTPSPGGGWICINGGWVPPTSSCTSPSPGAGWTCVGGGWLPPTSGGAGGGGCTGGDPFASLGGGSCVNGGWTFVGTTSGGCSTPDPFTAMGGGLCINGGWIPKTAG